MYASNVMTSWPHHGGSSLISRSWPSDLSPGLRPVTSSLRSPGWTSMRPASHFHCWHQNKVVTDRLKEVDPPSYCSSLLLLLLCFTWLELLGWCHPPPRRPWPRQQTPKRTATRVLPKRWRERPTSQRRAQPCHSADRTWGGNKKQGLVWNLNIRNNLLSHLVTTHYWSYQKLFQVETPEPRRGRLTAKPSGKFWMPMPMAKFLKETEKKVKQWMFVLKGKNWRVGSQAPSCSTDSWPLGVSNKPRSPNSVHVIVMETEAYFNYHVY